MVERRDVRTNGIHLSVTTAGPPDGPMVLLLHGFPECAHGWSRQLTALADAGWFCVVPDQRGYGHSEKPERTSAYAVRELVADALGLIDAFGRERCHVVSHDWGGIVGWTLATDHPERVLTLTAMNIPHPRVFARHLRTLGQLRKSWYMFALQIPRWPERQLAKDDFALLVRVLFGNTTGRPFTDADLAAYRDAWSQPGAIRGMIAWYRAAFRSPEVTRGARVTVPTLILFGQRDRALDWHMAQASADRCDDVVLELLPDAGHFVQHDDPERVNASLLRFLSAHR